MSKIWIKGEEITAEKLNETAYGLHVISQDTPNMTVHITPGVAIVNNAQVRYTGGNSPTIIAPTSNPRIDLVVIKQDGTIEIINGTENASPVAPLYPSDKLVLAEIYLRTSITKIKASDDSVEGYISLDARPITGVAPSMPAGVIFAFGGSSAPAGFLLCDGSAVSRTTYAVLFAAIGTSYGAGNGSTTFNLPDTRSSAIIGAGQKSFSLIVVIPYTGLDVSSDLFTTPTPHKFPTGTHITFNSSAGDPPKYPGLSSGSRSVDGSGYIEVTGQYSLRTPVGTRIRCTSQSSTNFVVGTDYYVINNSGLYIQVSQTPGGSLFGNGNSGSAVFQIYEPPTIGIDSGTCGVASGNELSMANASELLRVGDTLFSTNSISISGVYQNNFYYVVAVNNELKRFSLSSTPGGSPINVSGNGWISFDVVRLNAAYVSVQSDTTFKLSSTFSNSMQGICFDWSNQGSGNFTFDGGNILLTNRALGEIGGEEKHRLSILEMPSHPHRIFASGSDTYGSGTADTVDQYIGGNTPHNNLPPFVVANFIIKT